MLKTSRKSPRPSPLTQASPRRIVRERDELEVAIHAAIDAYADDMGAAEPTQALK